jgi:hypothetical protein
MAKELVRLQASEDQPGDKRLVGTYLDHQHA